MNSFLDNQNKGEEIDQSLLVTVAIIFQDDKFFLAKRAREPFNGFWAFVGGCGAFKHVNNPIEAVKYEVKVDLKCGYEPEFFGYNYAVFNEIHTVSLFFVGNIVGEPTPNSKYVAECRWFSLKEVAKLTLAFDHNKILNQFIKKFLS